MSKLKNFLKNNIALIILFLSALTISISITVSEGLLIVSIIWLIIYLYKNKINIFKDCPYFIPFLIYFFTTIFGFIFGSPFAIIKGNLFDLWTILFIFVGYYLVKENHIRPLLFAFILGGVALSVSVILDVVVRGAARGDGFLSIYMTSGNILALASSIAVAIIISKYETFRVRIIYTIATIIMITGVGFTGTRGAYLAFVVALFVGLIIRFKVKGFAMSLVAIAITIISILLSDVASSRFLDLFSGVNDYTTSHGWRFLLWENSFKVFLDYPIFGVGEGAYKPIVSAMMPHIDGMASGHAHNSYIQQLVLFGIVGFLAFAYFLGKVVYNLSKKVISNSYSLIGLMLSITFLVEGLTEDNFRDSEVRMFFFFTAGILLMAIRKGLNDKVAK